MVLAWYAQPLAEPLILDNLIGEVRPASKRPDLTPVFSFNSEGLWQGTGSTSAGDPVSRLSRWREVIAKARAGVPMKPGENMSLIGQIWPALRGHRARLRGRRGGAYRRDARHAADAAATEERRQRHRAGAGALAAEGRRGADGAGALRAVRHRLPPHPLRRRRRRAALPARGRPQPLAAPRWFAQWLPIAAAPGVAQVSDGWRALGHIEVESQGSFAHDELWHAVQRGATAMLMLGLLAAAAGALMVGRIRRPLERAVEQAHSLERGEYVTVEEPSTPELRRLVSAMNSMVLRLGRCSRASHAGRDAAALPTAMHATGLSNRAHFMGQLDAALHREDGSAEGGLRAAHPRSGRAEPQHRPRQRRPHDRHHRPGAAGLHRRAPTAASSAASTVRTSRSACPWAAWPRRPRARCAPRCRRCCRPSANRRRWPPVPVETVRATPPWPR